MAIYDDPRSSDGVDVFDRGQTIGVPQEQPPRPSPDSTGNRSFAVPLLLAVLIAVGIGGALWWMTQPQIDLTVEVEETLPYRQSAAYLGSYDRIVEITGPSPTITTGDQTMVDWELTGSGTAVVELDLEGPEGRTSARVAWTRERDAWMITSASYLDATGSREAVPVGNGDFLDARGLKIWRAADGGTLLGRGQRELVQGRPLQAIQLFNQALSDKPEDVDALWWRGRAFESVGNSGKARADYQRILSFEPDHGAALARLDAMQASPPPGVPQADPPTRRPPPVRETPPTALIPE